MWRESEHIELSFKYRERRVGDVRQSWHSSTKMSLMTARVLNHFRAGGTGPVGQAKTGPLFSANSVMIVAFTNAIGMNVVMIVTISNMQMTLLVASII